MMSARYQLDAARRQGGLSLLELIVLLTLVSGLAVVTVRLLLDRPGEMAEVSLTTLQRADQALLGFLASEHRLPCPDTNGDGFENCDGGVAKGMLPYRSLGFYGALIGPDAPRLQYMAYRDGSDQGALDLARASMRYQPEDWAGVSYDYDAVNGLDFCVAAAAAATQGFRSDRAHVAGAGQNVVYGLAAPGRGDSDGNGSLFDGNNANGDPVMESPWRQRDANYDDVVITRSFAGVIDELNCASAIASVQTTALALDTVKEIQSQAEWLKVTAIIGAVVDGVKTIVVIVKLGLAIKQTVASVTTLTAAVSGLSAAIASCAVLVGCALIPTMAAAVVAAGVAIGLSATAAALAVGGLVAQATATVLSSLAAARANAEITDEDRPDDWDDLVDEVDGLDISGLEDIEDELVEQLDILRDEEREAQEDLNDANSDVSDRLSDRRDVRNRLRACAIEADEPDDDDDEPDDATQRLLDRGLDVARQTNRKGLEVAQLESELENSIEMIEQLEDALDEINASLADNPTDDERQALLGQRSAVQSQLTDERSNRNSLQSQLSTAIGEYLQLRRQLGSLNRRFNNQTSCSRDLEDYFEADAELAVAQIDRDEARARRDQARDSIADIEDALVDIRNQIDDVQDGDDSATGVTFWDLPEDILRTLNARGVSP